MTQEENPYIAEWKRLKVVLDEMESKGQDAATINKVRSSMIAYFNKMNPAEQKAVAKLYIPYSPNDEVENESV